MANSVISTRLLLLRDCSLIGVYITCSDFFAQNLEFYGKYCIRGGFCGARNVCI